MSGHTREEAIGLRCSEVFKANICKQQCALQRSVESGRRLGSTPRLPGVSILVALGLTFALGFFAVAHIRAARLLREVTREAPVFNTTVSSIAVGVAVWLAYALLARQLRREVQRTRAHRRW